jgi:hypothetical protein
VEAAHPDRIIIFGSAARGDIGPDSDEEDSEKSLRMCADETAGELKCADYARSSVIGNARPATAREAKLSLLRSRTCVL